MKHTNVTQLDLITLYQVEIYVSLSFFLFLVLYCSDNITVKTITIHIDRSMIGGHRAESLIYSQFAHIINKNQSCSGDRKTQVKPRVQVEHER